MLRQEVNCKFGKKENAMNRNIILGNCQQFVGRTMQVWGRVTRDPFSLMAGRRKEHIGNMQEMYGRFEMKNKSSMLGSL